MSPYLGSVPLKNCAPVETAAKNDFAINQAVGGLKSEWTLLDVRDGLTQTILYGEKLLRGSTPSGAGDEDAMLVGMDDDNHRSTTHQLGRVKVIDLAYATLLVACFMAFAAYRGTTRPGMDWLWPTMNDHLGAEYNSISKSIVSGRGFSDPFQTQSGPTAWRCRYFRSSCC